MGAAVGNAQQRCAVAIPVGVERILGQPQGRHATLAATARGHRQEDPDADRHQLRRQRGGNYEVLKQCTIIICRRPSLRRE